MAEGRTNCLRVSGALVLIGHWKAHCLLIKFHIKLNASGYLLESVPDVSAPLQVSVSPHVC